MLQWSKASSPWGDELDKSLDLFILLSSSVDLAEEWGRDVRQRRPSRPQTDAGWRGAHAETRVGHRRRMTIWQEPLAS